MINSCKEVFFRVYRVCTHSSYIIALNVLRTISTFSMRRKGAADLNVYR